MRRDEKEMNNEAMLNLQEAIDKMSEVARKCGVTLEEAIAATSLQLKAGVEAQTKAIKQLTQKLNNNKSIDTIQEIQKHIETKEKESAKQNDEFSFDIPKFDMNDYKVEFEDEWFKEYAPVQPMDFSI
jgi:3-methyladenine DNA glycosylase AlkD